MNSRGGSKAGTREAIQAVSNLCRCGINYYLKIDFEGFEKFVDTLGGIDVELPEPVKLTYAGKTLPAGKQRLNGSTALELVRERESLKDGDSKAEKSGYGTEEHCSKSGGAANLKSCRSQKTQEATI